jgi:hypothetical protein
MKTSNANQHKTSVPPLAQLKVHRLSSVKLLRCLPAYQVLCNTIASDFVNVFVFRFSLKELNLSADYILETQGLTKEFKGFVAVNQIVIFTR